MKSYYPDISEILLSKMERRQALAVLSWEEKVSIIKQMQKLLPKGLWKDRVTEKRGIDPDPDTHRDRDVHH